MMAIESQDLHDNFGTGMIDVAINFRGLLVLTVGALDKPVTTPELYTLTRTLARRIRSNLRFDIPSYINFLKMLAKLHRQGVIHSKPIGKGTFGCTLSPQGEGELDTLLFRYEKIYNDYEEFRNIALLAGS